MRISPSRLLGTAPQIDPDLLADGAHQVAQNVRLDSGGAEPWKAPATVATPTKGAAVQTIYRYGDDVVGDATHWFNLLQDGDFARGPVADDDLERVYYTEEGQPPKMTRSDLAIGAELPNAYRLLGLPSPDISGVTVSISSRAITSLTFSGGTVTATTSVAIEFEIGETFNVVVQSATETEYNGEFTATKTGANTFTYAITGTPTSPATGTPTYHLGGSFEDRIYLVAFVGDGNEVGPASDPITVRLAQGQIVTLNNLPTTATWTDRTGSTVVPSKRIYQSVGSGYALEATIALATASYQSTAIPVSQTFLPDYVQIPPPADLRSIKAMESGAMVGLSGDKDVCFSERFLPHSWPTEYRLAVDYPHVGVGVFGASTVIFTNSYPYVATGSDPNGITFVRVRVKQGCVSKRSIADAGFGSFCATPDGLMLIGDEGVQIVTEGLMTRRDWQALKPETILGVFHDGRYFGFYDDGTTQAGFIYRHADRELTWTDLHATAAYADERTDSLYLLIGGNIQRWDSGAPLTATLKSKRYRVMRQNMTCAKVISDAYPVTFRYYADGVLKQTKTVTNDLPFRLPSGFRPDYIEFEADFTGRILPVQIASSMEEIV